MEDDHNHKIQQPLLDDAARDRFISLQEVSEKLEKAELHPVSQVEEPKAPSLYPQRSEYDDLEAELDKIYDEPDDEMLVSNQRKTRATICKAYLKSSQIQNKTYNPYMIPPDWEMAEDHLKAVSIGVPVKAAAGQPINVDEMSGRPVEVREIPLCSSRNKLNFLGPAYPMYFQFLFFTFGLLLVMLLFSGGYGLYTNAQGDFCNSTIVSGTDSSTCVKSSSTFYSLANKKSGSGETQEHKDKMDEYNVNQRFCNIVAYALLIFFFQWFRYRQRVTAKVCNDLDTSIADYTFEVRNIPKLTGVDIRKEVWKFIEENALPGEKLNIKKVSCCFDVAEKITVESQIEELVHQKAKLIQRKQKGKQVDNELNSTSGLIKNLKETLKKMERDNLKGDSTDFVNIAYITVNTQKQYWDVINHWKIGYFQSWRKKSHTHLKMGDNFLTIQAAPEPSDVFWENLGVPKSTRMKNIVLVNLICVAILILCFGGVFGMYELKAIMIKHLQDDHESSLETSFGIKATSYLASFAIVLINYLLQYLIRKLAFWEKHSCWTHYYTSVAVKLAWAQFVNTSMITFAVAYFTYNYWGPGGMIESIMYVFQMNAFYTPIYNAVNIFYWLAKYSRDKARKLGDKSGLTQKEAMALFENPKVDFATSYSGIVKSLFSAAFYAPVVPAALIWTMIGVFLCYWVDRYNILRKVSVGRALGVEIALEMTEVMEWYLIIFGISNFAFDYLFFGQISPLTYLLLGIALVNAVFPMEWLNIKIFGELPPEIGTETYDECKYYLDEEYDRFNPATKELAIASYARMMQGAAGKKQFEKFVLKNNLV